MQVRALTLALVLALAACAPPQQSAEQSAESEDAAQTESAAASPAPANNPEAASLAGDIYPAEWFFDPRRAAYAIGGEQEATLIITCAAAAGPVELQYAIDIPHGQRASIRIITAARSFDVPMVSNNEGMGYIIGEIPSSDANLDALAAAQDRFGIVYDGFTARLAWEPGIADTLRACGV